MKRALIVTSTAGFARGFLLHDMLLLQNMGFEVHCAANGKGMSFSAEELFPERGVVFHQVDFSSVKPIGPESWQSYKQIRKLLKEQNFSVIHCHTPIVGFIVRLAALPYRATVLYTTHGLAFPKGCSLKEKLIYGTAEWLGIRMCDGIITINHEDHATLRKMGAKNVYYINGVGVNTARYHKIEIDRDAYRKSIGVEKDDIMVLSVGEISARKNQQIIIRALAKLGDPRYVFVICGKAMTGSAVYEKLVSLAKELNVRVKFLGFRRDIPQIAHCADIAVMPSLREGLGLAGIEAMAAGVPVIGSDIQGIKDYVVDGVTGYLCDPRDADAFAEKIGKLSNEKLRKSMRDACIDKSEEFRTDISYAQMARIYKKELAYFCEETP